MRCGTFSKERSARDAVDSDGVNCSVRFPRGAQRSFDAAYERWRKRRGLPKGTFQYNFGKYAE
jgi:hypothetical protein